MRIRRVSVLFFVVFCLFGSIVDAQPVLKPKPRPEIAPNSQTRAIRRDIPLSDNFRAAYMAKSRNLLGTPAEAYWQNDADYQIYVRLDPGTQTLFGRETITYHNNSPQALQMIAIRLDHNIFRARVPRGSSVPAETTDGMIVTSAKLNGVSIDLTAQSQTGRRTDEPQAAYRIVGLDQTVARIFLKDPIAPNTKVSLEFEWNTKLPGGDTGSGHRMTQRWGDQLFQPTQWFPRVANYDDIRGWETSPYLGPSEFYNNFGKYDVKIEVPEGWLVSATGSLLNKNEVLSESTRANLKQVLTTNDEKMIIDKDQRGAGRGVNPGSKLVYNFVADRVNDFAWAASKDFVWRALKAEIPGRDSVIINMFYLPENEKKFEMAGKITRHALQFYSKFSGTYPFPQLTLQDGPSSGMEYPMVINSNQGAADHETYHQWIPMMVGTNETRFAWMDEGFNNYSNIFSAADAAGKPASLDGIGQRYGAFNGNEDEAPLMWNSNYAGDGYRFQAYSKTTLMFSMLGGIVGDDAMNAAIKKYIETWKFKHPTPWDFMFFMNNELKRDLGWFWYYWLFTNESVDGSIAEVTESGNGDVSVKIHNYGQMPSPIVLLVDFEETNEPLKPMPDATFLGRNQALVRWNENVWFNGSRNYTGKLSFGNRKIKKLTLDPYGRFPDSDVTDNIWEKGK